MRKGMCSHLRTATIVDMNFPVLFGFVGHEGEVLYQNHVQISELKRLLIILKDVRALHR